MTMQTIGDLAQSFVMRRQNNELKEQVNRLTRELTSGQKEDKLKALGWDYSFLADTLRSLKLLDGFGIATREATVFTQTMQTVLNDVIETSGDLGARLLTSAASNLPSVQDSTARAARDDMAHLISRLNTSAAGRTLFAGAATDAPALADPDTILTALRGAVAGQTTQAGFLAAVDDWFHEPGGGFETSGYLGSNTSLPAFQLAEGETVRFEMKADDTQIRTLLRNTAVAVLSGDASLGISNSLKANLQRVAGEGLMSSQAGVTTIASDLGFVQQRVEDSAAKNAAIRSGLQIARNDLVLADPYETATRLENLQYQLEGLYSLTVRMSKLTLMDYMR